jgi:hypothetical protein
MDKIRKKPLTLNFSGLFPLLNQNNRKQSNKELWSRNAGTRRRVDALPN